MQPVLDGVVGDPRQELRLGQLGVHVLGTRGEDGVEQGDPALRLRMTVLRERTELDHDPLHPRPVRAPERQLDQGVEARVAHRGPGGRDVEGGFQELLGRPGIGRLLHHAGQQQALGGLAEVEWEPGPPPLEHVGGDQGRADLADLGHQGADVVPGLRLEQQVHRVVVLPSTALHQTRATVHLRRLAGIDLVAQGVGPGVVEGAPPAGGPDDERQPVEDGVQVDVRAEQLTRHLLVGAAHRGQDSQRPSSLCGELREELGPHVADHGVDAHRGAQLGDRRPRLQQLHRDPAEAGELLQLGRGEEQVALLDLLDPALRAQSRDLQVEPRSRGDHDVAVAGELLDEHAEEDGAGRAAGHLVGVVEDERDVLGSHRPDGIGHRDGSCPRIVGHRCLHAHRVEGSGHQERQRRVVGLAGQPRVDPQRGQRVLGDRLPQQRRLAATRAGHEQRERLVEARAEPLEQPRPQHQPSLREWRGIAQSPAHVRTLLACGGCGRADFRPLAAAVRGVVNRQSGPSRRRSPGLQ